MLVAYRSTLVVLCEMRRMAEFRSHREWRKK